MSKSRRRAANVRKAARRERRAQTIGKPPGAWRVDPAAPHAGVRVVAFGPDEIEEHAKLDGLDTLRARFPVVWVDVVGLGAAKVLRRVGEAFSIHPLALEDVVYVHQRAKVEEYPGGRYVVVRRVRTNEDGWLGSEQVSLFFGKGFVVSFQEGEEDDAFAALRKRLRANLGRTRTSGADYLAYALLDGLVDDHFPVVDALGDRVEALSEGVLAEDAEIDIVSQVQDLRRDLQILRHAMWPLREAIQALLHDESGAFEPATRLYLRDCADHVAQIVELLESDREVASGLMDIYLSVTSNRMNEVMKVLTMIATIFIPLSFLTGLYGMNFDTGSPYNMPELGWRYGYPALLALMFGIALALVGYFRHKRWL